MALMSLRNFLKCGQMVNDSVIFNTRNIALSSTRRNTNAEEKKQDPIVQDISEKDKSEVNEEIEKLNKQISELTNQNSELLDKYKRSLADGENLRSRLTKQIAEAKIYGIQSFCKDLLDVADVLSKATETVPKEELNEKNPHLKSLYEGLIMTEAQLKNVFKRHGLEQVNPLNDKFNPNFHEALFQQVVDGKEPGTVVIVSKIGYKLNDRVIRPALVGVSKNSKSFMETFLDIFSCLICLGDILGNGTNLVQCVNGHTICEDCSTRCRICPVCRVPYDAGVIRNLLMEEMRDVLIRYFGIPQEETPINSDADLPLAGNDDDSDSTVILNMDEHMQRMEVDYIETPASTRQVYSGMGTNIRSSPAPVHHRIRSKRSMMMERCPIGCLLQK
ncbi:hypothetical protein JTB14_006011 [Gonioctena quinquepunctata]|nr:hypothetical protein JTB14_006011 [Gonioctena quinquepunctata]